VAFSSNRLAVVGAINGMEGAYVFSGFTNPLVFVPPLAKHFADWATGKDNDIITRSSF
jgi:glycine/D-amino acid oxidase-like deaminating enzyme